MSELKRKAEYVKDAAKKPHRFHTCHWPGCGKQCPPAMWGCKTHWFRLPAALRNKIWRYYQPGQELTCKPSLGYIETAREVEEWIQSTHGKD